MFAVIAASCLGLAAVGSALPAYVKSALGAAAAFAILEAADPLIPYPIVAGPHAAVAAILFAAPAAPLQKTAMSVLGGHVLAAGVAILQVKFLPPAAAVAMKTLVVCLAIGAQKAAGAVHPPAVGMAFVWATTGIDDPLKLVGPLIGCVILLVVQQIWLALTGDGKPKTA